MSHKFWLHRRAGVVVSLRVFCFGLSCAPVLCMYSQSQLNLVIYFSSLKDTVYSKLCAIFCLLPFILLSFTTESSAWSAHSCHFDESWSKRPHSKTVTPKTATTFLATKTATTKTATLYWSKRPHREDHNQNGQTAFGQNGRTGKTTTKTATLHLVKTATQEGGSLD